MAALDGVRPCEYCAICAYFLKARKNKDENNICVKKGFSICAPFAGACGFFKQAVNKGN